MTGSKQMRPGARVKWEAVAEQISRRIHGGQYGQNGFIPAERVLSSDFHVSRPTIRKALQHLAARGLIDSHPGIGRRVSGATRRAPEKAERMKVVALELPDIANRFFVEVADSVQYALLQRGYHLLLGSYRHQPELQEHQLGLLASQPVQGVILGHDASRDLPPAVRQFETLQIPLVLLFNCSVEAPFDSVVIDERAGVVQVMRYLFSLGHRRIAFCRPLAGTLCHPREIAFLEQMAGASAEVRQDWVVPLERIEGKGGVAAVRDLMRSKKPPTAVFAGNDRVALVLLKHLATLGLRIPSDVSVAGFDNLSFTEHLPVGLTTVDQPRDLLGRRAAELLLERLEYRVSGPPRHEVYQPRLVIRDSCAIPSNPTLTAPGA